ncbi:hypothetical protein HNV08_09410 [Winogradskyella eckloniae]|uniref:hypothetical protein n=1 Tax=Winogradskyella eckloniae TaxID=1089306 RepID=UPI0015646AB4|nr:hypothetical protein [Winogradskyella eckloniae]NRD20262.1 hypothetical protein [Winogradskyella eckloniae]
MNKTVETEFCTVNFYENYIITIIKEGIHIEQYHNETLINMAEDHYKSTPFVYITHRIHSYSVNPNIYKTTSKMKSLAGFAVVTKDYKALKNAQIEKLFLNKPFEIFSNLEDALTWKDELLNSK